MRVVLLVYVVRIGCYHSKLSVSRFQEKAKRAIMEKKVTSEW